MLSAALHAVSLQKLAFLLLLKALYVRHLKLFDINIAPTLHALAPSDAPKT